MALPMLAYTPVRVPPLVAPIELQFVDGPQNFQCDWEGVVHDNVATSGVRERVVERVGMMITFTMPAIALADMQGWADFIGWALLGGTFAFSPNADLATWCNCVLDDEGWKLQRVGRARYAATMKFRVVPDENAPADPVVILNAFYGVVPEVPGP